MTGEAARVRLAAHHGAHFQWDVSERVGTITLNRPERKNPLTFDSYAELRDLFRALRRAGDVNAVVITGAAGNFRSGGDVHGIIGPPTRMKMPALLEFTRLTGDLVKSMRVCPEPILAAVDGVCACAGAILAMAADLRLGTARSRAAFLFVRSYAGIGSSGANRGGGPSSARDPALQ